MMWQFSYVTAMYKQKQILKNIDGWAIQGRAYRTLHSYNLIWAVCHLFPQQRWRTHTNIQSRETIGQENHVTCVKLRPRLNFVPRFLEPISRHVFSINTSSSNTLSFIPISIAALTRSLQVTLLFTNRSKKPKKWISLADIHFFKTLWLFPASEKPTVSNHKKK